MTNKYASNEPYVTIGSSVSYSEIKHYYEELRNSNNIRYINNLMYMCRKLRFNRNLYDNSLEDAIPKLFQEIANIAYSPFQEVFKAWDEGRITFIYKDGTDYDKHNGYDNNYYIDKYIIDNYINGGNIYMVYIDINNRLSMTRFDKSSNPTQKGNKLWFTYLIDHIKYVKELCDNKALSYNNAYYNTKMLFKSMFNGSNKEWNKAIMEPNSVNFEDLNENAVDKLISIMEIIPYYEINIWDIVSIIQNSYGSMDSDKMVGKIIYSLSKLASEGKLRKVIKMEELNNE